MRHSAKDTDRGIWGHCSCTKAADSQVFFSPSNLHSHSCQIHIFVLQSYSNHPHFRREVVSIVNLTLFSRSVNLESALQTTRSEEVFSSDQPFYILLSFTSTMLSQLTKCEQVLDFLMEGAGGEPPSQLPPGKELQVRCR